jgi:hypothetical protein
MPKANRNQSDSVALEVQTGKSDAEAAAQEGIQLEVVKHDWQARWLAITG